MVSKKYSKRNIVLILASLYLFLWLISLACRPSSRDPSTNVDVSPIAEVFWGEVPEGVWISEFGIPHLKTSDGSIEILDYEPQGKILFHQKFNSDYLRKLPLLAESYGVIVAHQLPEWQGKMVLSNPQGHWMFEWWGIPLLDQSFRSFQLAGYWLWDQFLPFSWKFSPNLEDKRKLSRLVIQNLSNYRNVEWFDFKNATRSSLALLSQSLEADSAVQSLFYFDHLKTADVIDASDLGKWLAQAKEESVVSTQNHVYHEWLHSHKGKGKQQGVDAPWTHMNAFESAGTGMVMLIIAATTLISEDLACIGSGVLVSQGGFGFFAAVTGCILGIYFGDIALYLIGRVFGEKLLYRRPFRWILSKESVQTSEEWFEKRGAWILIASRFMPGTRVPIYFAAGVLKANFWMISTILAVAALLWVPMLVGISTWIGVQFIDVYETYAYLAVWVLLGVIFTTFFLIHRILPLFTFRGRKLALSKWKRLVRWEFWPAKAIYPPVVLYILWLGLRYRSLSLCTLANPIVSCGGLVNESKVEILDALQKGGAPVSKYSKIESELDLDRKLQVVSEKMGEWKTDFPVVLKPVQGERGKGVSIIRNKQQLTEYLQTTPEIELILQKFAEGIEFGVLYWRIPGQKNGQISSITRKVYTSIQGDGVSNLEQLILNDDRAICSANAFLNSHAHQLYRIPAKGEVIKLVDIGTHSRGSLFLDAHHLHSEKLVKAFDEISGQTDGYFLGRFDLKVPDEQSLKNGRNMQLLELNLLTSEPTHMYDPKHSLLYAWKQLMIQWRHAFEIGDANRKLGMKPMGTLALIKLIWQHYMKS